MTVSQLSLTDFRNLRSATLDFHPAINLISGDNGSGKSSLLESIYVLCQARSFRTHHLKQCIGHGKQGFLLFGRFSDYKVGLSRSEQKQEIKLDGEAVKRRSELASRTPVGIANTDSFDLVVGPPQQRRAYIDWCLFHVKHQYVEQWMQFRHALKQRNQLLKKRQDLNLLDYWNETLVKPSLVIQQYRRQYTALISNMLAEQMNDLLGDLNISLDYRAGWPAEIDLQRCLQINRDKDIKSGFTNFGVHRDNIRIFADGSPAAQTLSRGQVKSLCLAMLITALKLVRAENDRPMILLIDDLCSELDKTTQQQVFQQLLDLGIQMFITNIESLIPSAFRGKDFKMFHVEHGIIKSLKNT
ncbi:MAG: DNA replication/repair protein RecF [Gammaproteobacteria bacterium]